MPALMEPPPFSPVEPVTEVLHGVPVTDPYRWLEDQESPRTREWIAAQTRYARSYLDSIPGRERIRERIRELLDVETYDSLHKVGNRYFFRKRTVGQEQFCVCMREGLDGPDEVLIDPALRETGPHTAVKPLCISPDGCLMLYEVKQGGERTGTFELLDIQKREILPDVLPRGYLRGFAFAPDSLAFYYVHERIEATTPLRRAAYKHVIGTDFGDDEEVFVAGDDRNVRLHIIPGTEHLGFLVVRFEDLIRTDFYALSFSGSNNAESVIQDAPYKFGPIFLEDGRILAITDLDAPNLRIVEVRRADDSQVEFCDIVPSSDVPIQNWIVGGRRIFVSYVRNLQSEIEIFDLRGERLGYVQGGNWDTTRLLGFSEDGEEVFLERESFAKPIDICSYIHPGPQTKLWAARKVPFDSQCFDQTQAWFPAKDGTQIPMFLVGLRRVLDDGSHPTFMTSYGGYGVPMTPQFSVFVAFLMERGCLFALPNIRGGSEFGAEWHNAAKRQNRQVAFDDFISAAEWLIDTKRTEPEKLAIFGGSNSGLLVGAALTQRPELFRAVVCMVPMLDMLRYHLFDNAHVWREEFGTADDPDDFSTLFDYSPYHRVREGVPYPATMLVSGDADQNCNPLHARKMTARLQAANVSEYPVLLDYSRYRGHSPVLPLSDRVEALTDRMAFLCDQLGMEDLK
jgi:prolyl oligopeptidase